MIRRASILVCFAAILGGCAWTVLVPVSASAGGLEPCKGWCVEANSYWFQVLFNKGAIHPPDAEDQANMDKLAAWIRSVAEYLRDHPNEIAYKAAVLPLKANADPPEMQEHAVRIDWNIGVKLKTDETLWATRWFLLSPGNTPARTPPLRSVSLTKDMLLPTRDMKTYALVISFPATTTDGKDWDENDIASLVVTHDETASVSAAH